MKEITKIKSFIKGVSGLTGSVLESVIRIDDVTMEVD